MEILTLLNTLYTDKSVVRGIYISGEAGTSKSFQVYKYLKDNNISTYAAALPAKKLYTDIDFKKSCAIIFGTEDKGLSDEWIELVDEQIIIPMNGEIDSLNVSVSAGIIIYEVIRQRDI